MQHNPSLSASVDGDYVSNKTTSFDSDTPGCLGALKRQNTSSSDNDITAPVSATSSSQGSIQVLLEPSNDETTQEATPSPKRSPRRKSSLGKTDSMLRGSLNAQDFFGTERVLQDVLKDGPCNLPNEGRTYHIQRKKSVQTEKPKVVSADASREIGSLQEVSLSSQVAQNTKCDAVPSNSQEDAVLKAKVENCNVSSVLDAKANEESTAPEQVDSKCQCIIL